MLNVNGIAHIALSVKNIANSKDFYKKLMPFLGLKLVHEGKESIYSSIKEEELNSFNICFNTDCNDNIFDLISSYLKVN